MTENSFVCLFKKSVELAASDNIVIKYLNIKLEIQQTEVE